MSSLPNALDQALDIAGSQSQTDTATPLTDESGMLGRPVIGQSGANATISVGPSIVVSGLTNMTVSGNYISISGALNPNNNGSFEILNVISSNTVIINNALAVNETNLSWVERSAYSLQDDLNYTRTDRKAIKGVGYDQPVPEYYRCDDQVNPIPANLLNIAGHTTDAKSFVINKQTIASAISGTGYTTIFSAGNLKHADAVDITGVPIYDGFDTGRDDACFVQITDIDGITLQVLSGTYQGWIIYGRSFGGSSVSPDSVNIEFRCVPPGQDLSGNVAYSWEPSQTSNIIVNYGYRQCLDAVPDTGFRQPVLGKVESTTCFPKPNQIGEVLFAITPDKFDVALPVTSNQGWLVNDDGLLLVNQVYPDGYNYCYSNSSCFPKPNQVGEVLFAITPDRFEVVLPVTSNQGWSVNDDGLLLVNQVYPDGYNYCYGGSSPSVPVNYFMETYPMSISTAIITASNATTTYGSVIYNISRFTCSYIDALCWSSNGENAQVAIYDINGNRLATSSVIPNTLGIMSFPITYTLAANTRYCFAIWVNNGCEFAAINSGTGTNPGDTKLLTWQDTNNILPTTLTTNIPYIKTVWLRAR
jgi:hypothetical protein